MKNLIIIGAGGFGREVLSWAIQVEMEQNVWPIKGFLDDNPDALNGYEYNVPILGNPMKYRPAKDDVFICAISEPKIKLKVCQRLEDAGADFTTLVHSSVVVGQNSTISKGCIICPGAVITTDVHVGKHVIINVSASVGHDAIIGDGSTLNGHVDVTGFVELGQGVFAGSHAAILPGAKVGDFSVVGAGSVVLRTVKPGATVMGVPAIQISGFGSDEDKKIP